MDKLKIGLIGCGVISDVYYKNIPKFHNLELYASADLIMQKAIDKTNTYGGKALTVEEMMSEANIKLILNLTIPESHFKINMKALEAGKNVYCEKPLAVKLEDGINILNTARQKKLLVGCAPDTFLGSRIQMMRKLMDDGWIGKPVAATAFMTCHGHETWHPNPGFFYKKGAGPLFDMGPYYITTLVTLLGPVKRICGIATKTFDQRRISSSPLSGETIDVEVPTHVTGILEFCNGTIVTMVISFDIWDSNLPRMEIYGSEGTISITDPDPLAGPNIFCGEIKLKRKEEADWSGDPTKLPRKEQVAPWPVIPPCFECEENSRGLGLADMASAIIRGDGEFRANGELAYHVLETMHGFYKSSQTGKYYEMQSTCGLSKPMKINMPKYAVEN